MLKDVFAASSIGRACAACAADAVTVWVEGTEELVGVAVFFQSHTVLLFDMMNDIAISEVSEK